MVDLYAVLEVHRHATLAEIRKAYRKMSKQAHPDTGGLTEEFARHGHALPEALRLSCGFPSKGGKSKTIGECHFPSASAGQTTEIFIRPDLSDSMEVGAVVIHELAHAVLGPGHGHGKVFKKLALALGLTGKMTATVAGEAAKALMARLIERIGPYPHSTLRFSASAPSNPGGGLDSPLQKNVTCPFCGFRAKIRVDQISIGRLVCPQDDIILLMKGEK